MKKKNIEKVLCLLFDMNRLDLDGVSIKGLRDILSEHLSNKQPESNNEDDEMEEFKWENCIKGVGFYYDANSHCAESTFISDDDKIEMQDTAESDLIIESNIAACKLSWIITKINKKYPEKVKCGLSLLLNGRINYVYGLDSALPKMNNEMVAKVLIKTNLPLIKQYFGIKE